MTTRSPLSRAVDRQAGPDGRRDRHILVLFGSKRHQGSMTSQGARTGGLAAETGLAKTRSQAKHQANRSRGIQSQVLAVNQSQERWMAGALSQNSPRQKRRQLTCDMTASLPEPKHLVMVYQCVL